MGRCSRSAGRHLRAIAAGVSPRRYATTQEPIAQVHRPSAASKSAVSRRFVQLSQQQLDAWLTRRLDGLDLPVVMVDGIHFRECVILVALGIDAEGNKHVLGLREGSAEATRVVASLLAELVDRGLDADRMRCRRSTAATDKHAVQQLQSLMHKCNMRTPDVARHAGRDEGAREAD